MSRDDLKIFDELDDEAQDQESFARINENQPRQPRSRRGLLKVVIALAIIAALALGVFRFMQWRDSRNDESNAASDTTSVEAAQPETTATAKSSTYVDGDNAQAVETRDAPQPSQVAIPVAKQPAVDQTKAESVISGFITIINSRNSQDDFSRVEEWVAPYSLIDDLSSFDIYKGDNGSVLPAPATVRNIELKDKAEGQPADTPTRVSKVVEATVEAHTGQKVKLTWQVTVMKDGENWKVTTARLDSWQGA